MKNLARAGLAAALAAASIATAHAAVSDATGDILGTYTGISSSSLDIVSANVTYFADTHQFSLTSTMNGAIGSAPAGSQYIFGFNRGAGTARFVGGTPSIGAGVIFDSVLLLNLNGSVVRNLFDGVAAAPVPGLTSTISGNTISLLFDETVLPNNGFTFTNYTWNLWTRGATTAGTLAGNVGIPDFAPDAAMQLVETPEPGSIGLLALGLSLTLIAAQRSRRRKQ